MNVDKLTDNEHIFLLGIKFAISFKTISILLLILLLLLFSIIPASGPVRTTTKKIVWRLQKL